MSESMTLFGGLAGWQSDRGQVFGYAKTAGMRPSIGQDGRGNGGVALSGRAQLGRHVQPLLTEWERVGESEQDASNRADDDGSDFE